MDSEEHKARSRKLKEHHEKQQSQATGEKGLLMVYTGPGKGKFSSAFGMAIRIVGHGKQLGVVQFIKGAMPSAEREVIAGLAGVEWHTIGDGFTWDTQDREKDVATARRAWAKAMELLLDPAFAMVILDELCVVLAYKYLPLEDVLEGLARRPMMTHVVLTGRGAPPELIEAADLVSRIEAVKHPYRSGIKAQPGVEY
jgi:cob(I)alamin adenosyltransferase